MTDVSATDAPAAELDPRFSSPDARPTPWHEADAVLDGAEIFWLSTVRADGRPHVTPLLAVWQDTSLCFCTGPTEQKARNLATNPACVLTTGSNELSRGLDVVVEGQARRLRQPQRLQRIATTFRHKYGPDWEFTVDGDAFTHRGGRALVFEVQPTVVFGFRKGAFSQTRWRFTRPGVP